MLARQSLFAFDRQLGGKAESQIWGFAISPLHDLVAVISSYKPSHSPSYVLNHQRRSDLQIQLQDKSSSGTFRTPYKINLDDDTGRYSSFVPLPR